MTEEVRVTSSTGGQKGSKEARYDLIPAGPLRTLAELYGRGALKYTTYGDCTCASAERPPTPEGSAGAATTSGSRSTTPSTPSGNVRTCEPGTSDPAIGSDEPPLTPSVNEQAAHGHIGSMDSPARSTPPSWLSPAGSVGNRPSTSTTTTLAASKGADVASAAASATDATSVSATSKAGSPRTERQHSPGCPALSIVESGDRNWERGYDWSLSFAALNRHLWQFWAGEDIDEETGKPHLASVAWHAFALLEFMERHPDFDNRPR